MRSAYLFWKFLFSILFPLSVYVAYFQKARNDRFLNLAWLTFFFGSLYSYLFAESGEKISHTNFSWSARITLFILFAQSVIFIVRENWDILGRGVKKWDYKFIVCALLYGAHLGSGIYYYYYILANSQEKQYLYR
jgi:hypothetical protein